MSTVLVNALPGTLPTGFCPTGATALQDLYNEFILRTQFSLSADKAFYNFGPTAPTPENRQFPWLQTSSGYPVRWWVFIGGFWVWPHAVPASSLEWRLWGGTTVALETYDGGESAAIAVSPTTGPMWEVNSDFDGRSPMGAGAIPSSTPAKTLTLAENYGDGTHVITANELPDISTTIDVGILIPGHSSDDGSRVSCDGGNSSPPITNNPTLFPTYDVDVQGMPQVKVQKKASVTSDTPMTMVHPVRGCYIIKRTARIYYRQ